MQDLTPRCPSPTRRYDAVITERLGGMTKSSSYNVAILTPPAETGPSVVSLYGAARSDSAGGVNVRWVRDDTLLIRYLSARRVDMYVPVMQLHGDDIQIILEAGVKDSTAPRGQMYANLRRNH